MFSAFLTSPDEHLHIVNLLCISMLFGTQITGTSDLSILLSSEMHAGIGLSKPVTPN